MDAHDLYVLAAYLVAAVTLGVVLGVILLDRRRLLRQERELRSLGLRRRSEPETGRGGK